MPLPHASALTPALHGPLPRCTKTPERVYGFDRNGCTKTSGAIIAEQNDLICGLGVLALGEAAAEAATWAFSDAAGQQPYVTVNVSTRQFHDPDFGSQVADVLASSGLAPDRLVLEVTESVAFNDTTAAMSTSKALQRLGVSVALDDFGTGYSSLSYFSLLQPRLMKIDRSFLKAAHDSPQSERLLEAIVLIGPKLDAAVVGEGIETSKELGTLCRCDCDLGQGYLFRPAVPPSELSPLLKKAWIAV